MKKYLSAFFLMLLFVCHFPGVAVYADDDPNTSVSDYLNNEEESDKEKQEIKTDFDTPAADRTSDVAAVGSSAGDYIKVLVALVFVVGILLGLLKLVNRKNRLYDKNRFMKNMGGISLGQHKSIQLVIVGESYYLIGVGDDIRLLKEITDPEEISKLVEFYEGDSAELASGMLGRILTRMTGKSKVDASLQTEESTEFSEVFKSKLDEMKEERQRHISQLTEKERNRDE